MEMSDPNENSFSLVASAFPFARRNREKTIKKELFELNEEQK